MIRKFQLRSVSNHILDKRCFADNPKNIDSSKSKQLMIKSTSPKICLVTRRVRPSDVPRVLRFMREHARNTWPGKAAPPLTSHMVLSDYVSRILAQGFSMLTEQKEMPYGWANIRGIALVTSYTPWDSITLDKFARCIKSPPARRLLEFSALSLRAPALHKKYQVHKVLQVIPVIPEHHNSLNIAATLINSTIKRGRDSGFAVMRFDVNCDAIANMLENMKMNKEWHMKYKVLPTKIVECKENTSSSVFHIKPTSSESKPAEVIDSLSYVTVFTAVLNNADT